MDHYLAEAKVSKDFRALSNFLSENPENIRYFVRAFDTPELTSDVLQHFGTQILNYYKNKRVPILIEALAEKNKLEVIKEMVSFDQSIVNETDILRETALMYAVRNNLSIDIIEYFLLNGANVNSHNHICSSPLHVAQTLQVVKLLIDRGANINWIDSSGLTPLMYAIKRKRDNQIILEFLKNGADINPYNQQKKSALHLALCYGYDDDIILEILCKTNVINRNIKDCFGNTPLWYAIAYAERGQQRISENIISEMICKRCIVDKNCFMHALKSNVSLKIVEQLSNFVCIRRCFDRNGNCVLHHVRDGQLVSILISKGAPINHKNKKGRTPLAEAICCNRDIRIIQSLLFHGADNISINHLYENDFKDISNEVLELLFLNGLNIILKTERQVYVFVRIILYSMNRGIYSTRDLYFLRYVFLRYENINFPENLPIYVEKLISELNSMKCLDIIPNLSFYQFCLKQYKLTSTFIKDSECDFVKKNFQKIKEMFPLFRAEIIIKIKIHFKIQKRIQLLHHLSKVMLKTAAGNDEDAVGLAHNRSILNSFGLNHDCLCLVAKYLNDFEVKCLLHAAIISDAQKSL